MSTYTPKLSELEHEWYLVDARDQVLGRLASQIATYLQGKNKPTYARFLDTGDYIVVVNCKHLRVTGKKQQDKIYYRHTGYPGGIKSTNFDSLIEKDPMKVLYLAVKGMLPRGPLGRSMLTKLKLFAESEHDHAAQKPQVLEMVTDVRKQNVEAGEASE